MKRALHAMCLALCAATARADPDEAWIVRASTPEGLRPLLVLIVDRSAAMATTTPARAPYDASVDYGAMLAGEARCDRRLVYWRRGPGPAPGCASQRGLELDPSSAVRGLHCAGARNTLPRHGFFVAARAAQWSPAAAGGYWSSLKSDHDAAVECRSDRARHGATPGEWFATDGAAGPWSTTAANEIAWDRAPLADPYIFYTGNFLNYLRALLPVAPRPLADIASESLATAAEAVDELQVALVVTSPGDGGVVALAPVDAATAAARLPGLLAGAPNDAAPLAETLAETTSWLAGGRAIFGAQDTADPRAFDSAAIGHYASPVTHACRAVTLGFLTAGQASDDESAAMASAALPGFAASSGDCGANCLAALARWLTAGDLRSELPAGQSSALNWIAPPGAVEGLGLPDAPSARFEDTESFIQLVTSALQRDAAVAAGPRLSAAGFVRADHDAHAPAVLFALSAPRPTSRWSGNVFRYALRAPDSPLGLPLIVDRDGEPAIARASGLPLPSSRSLWSDAPDADLLAGGAAGRLPVATARRLFSNLVSSDLSDGANRLAAGNAALEPALFGLASSDTESAATLVDWLAGLTELGDPGLAAPTVADYPDEGMQVAFVATHDGLLHALDGGDGTELWAFMPRALLPRLRDLARNATTTVRTHGIDGPVVLHRHDANGDGRIDRQAGDHLFLLFSLGRGGDGIYALDVASPLAPRLLWSRSSGSSDSAESWATPVVTRLTIAEAPQNAGHWVVLLAGGYDRAFDSSAPRTAGAGATLELADAETGVTLWQASGTAGDDVALQVNGLDASLPSAPRALDRDGDGELDRAYAIDVTGGLWRFDFSDGQPAATLGSARLVARLGDGRQRFFASPDVSLLRRNGRVQTVLAVGSGWLARPLDATIADRVYVLYEPESGGVALTDAMLHDATGATDGIPTDAPGWYLRLDGHGPGEKIIGSTVTFDRVLRFQTYQPLPPAADAPCGPPRAVHRLLAYDIRTALPRPESTVSEEDDPDDRPAAGLPSGLRFAFPGRYEGDCAGCRPRPVGFAGAFLFDPSYSGDPVRTSWRKLPPDSR